MDQFESEIESNPRDELLLTHKKEKKDLQAKIQGLKHSIPKGDKKKKKDVFAQIAQLELDLTEKHKKELLELEQSIEKDLSNLSIDDEPANSSEPLDAPKMSKAQKRRDKKAALEKEREERIAIEKLENINGVRQTEIKKFKAILESRQLEIYDIPSDGNCMYKALGHQLSLRGENQSVDLLRRLAANYLMQHESDFLPFMSDPKTGEPMSSEDYINYCNTVATTIEWGGQIELQALSHQLKSPIEIIQATGPSIYLGENYSTKSPLLISYHRHIFGLGEHYNSIVPKKEETEDPL